MIRDKIKKINSYIVERDFLLAFVAIGLIFIILLITDVGCPTRFFTGVCCPGCGMTRAVIHLFKGDIRGAIHYHPLVFTLPVIAILFILKDKINKVVLNTLLVIIIILFIVTYIIRLLDLSNEVVYADVTKSIIYKVFEKTIKR